MIKVQVGEQDEIVVTFGNNHNSKCFQLTGAELTSLFDFQMTHAAGRCSEEKIRELSAAVSRHLANVAEANEKIAKANEIIGGLREGLSDAELRDLLRNAKPGPITFVNNEPAWRPIETAPKDGTEVIVLCGALRDLAQWGGTEKGWVTPGVMGLKFLKATHWMPLPEPPR